MFLNEFEEMSLRLMWGAHVVALLVLVFWILVIWGVCTIVRDGPPR